MLESVRGHHTHALPLRSTRHGVTIRLVDWTALGSALSDVWKLVGPAALVALGWLLARTAEQARWQRKDRYRWHADKRQLYGAFLTAIDHYDNDMRRTATWLDVASVPKDEPPQDLPEPDLDAADRARQEIALLSPPEVSGPVERLYNLEVSAGLGLVGLQLRLMNLTPPAAVGVPTVDEYHILRDEVITTMRADLAVDQRARV